MYSWKKRMVLQLFWMNQINVIKLTKGQCPKRRGRASPRWQRMRSQSPTSAASRAVRKGPPEPNRTRTKTCWPVGSRRDWQVAIRRSRHQTNRASWTSYCWWYCCPLQRPGWFRHLLHFHQHLLIRWCLANKIRYPSINVYKSRFNNKTPWSKSNDNSMTLSLFFSSSKFNKQKITYSGSL